MVVLRRFDCVLEKTKPAVLTRYAKLKETGRDKTLGDKIDKDLNHRGHAQKGQGGEPGEQADDQ